MPRYLHELLEASARKYSDRLAFSLGTAGLDYDRLNRSANRLARLLQKRGLGSGKRIGIHADRSLAAVQCVFGVLKSGAAYVPLDPAAPAHRNAAIIEDCQLNCILDPGRIFPAHVAGIDETLFLDPEEGLGETRESAAGPLSQDSDESDPGLDLDPESAAYILYTSGSTGRPKGVVISHRASLAFVLWAAEYFALETEDVLAGQAPLMFDISILHLFAGLAAGARTELVPRAILSFPRSLADFIERKRITVWYSVPSLLIHLARDGRLAGREFDALRAVLFAGEVFPPRHLESLMRQVPGAKYHNLYGPTETNVCTVHSVTERPDPTGPALPIGRPCAGARVWILKEDGRLAGPGETGELFVGGPVLMNGYWNRKEHGLTASGPIDEPVYATGDLVRRDPVGDLHYLGRRDEQLKIRGYRIEPGDVESALNAHGAVEEAVVFGVADEQLGERLEAVVRTTGPVEPAELSRHCAERLPAYMVPAVFSLRESLPLTPTGKIDRRQLRNERTATPAAVGF